MAALDRESGVEVTVDGSLGWLIDPVRRALGSRHHAYRVHIEPRGRAGQVLLVISGSTTRVPLILSPQDLEPGDVFRLVSDTMERFGL